MAIALVVSDIVGYTTNSCHLVVVTVDVSWPGSAATNMGVINLNTQYCLAVQECYCPPQYLHVYFVCYTSENFAHEYNITLYSQAMSQIMCLLPAKGMVSLHIVCSTWFLVIVSVPQHTTCANFV